jgi:prepilin-type N-terminal cleavage/methylation domain-containing protein
MVMKLPSKNTNGFTIIEVIIVLAIAGLIILIVLLAVPALQRNARNTSRKSDANIMAEAVYEYNTSVLTSSTAAPPGGYDCSPPLTFKLFCQFVDGHLSYYNMSDVYFHSNQHTPPAAPAEVNSADKILRDSYMRCGDDGRATLVGAGVKSAVILYAIESRNGLIPQCVDLTLHSRAP